MIRHFLTARPRGGPWRPVGLYRREGDAIREGWRRRNRGDRIRLHTLEIADARS